MNEVYELLKKAGTYFLGTCEDGQPRVRPFGTIHLYRDCLYFQTGKSKAVSRQLHANPRFELCAMVGGDWLRVEGSAVLDDDPEARANLPELEELYNPDNPDDPTDDVITFDPAVAGWDEVLGATIQL